MENKMASCFGVPESHFLNDGGTAFFLMGASKEVALLP